LDTSSTKNEMDTRLQYIVADHENYEAYEPVAFLISKKSILRTNAFEDPSDSLFPVYSWNKHSIPKYCFISHRWLYDSMPDNQLNTILLVLQAYAKLLTSVDYFWIDIFCILSHPKNSRIQDLGIEQILNHAYSFLILPFRMSPSTLVPYFDLECYCMRAWCITEFSFMARHLGKVQIARLVPRDSALKVQFVGSSSIYIRDEMESMSHSFVLLKELLAKNDFESFCKFYEVTEKADYSFLWNTLLNNSHNIADATKRLCNTSSNETHPDHKQVPSSLVFEDIDEPDYEHHLYDFHEKGCIAHIYAPQKNVSGDQCECHACVLM